MQDTIGKRKINETVCQFYNGKEILISTELVKFYNQIGLRVTNFNEFIQFLPGRILEPFCKKIYSLRCEATRENNPTKQLAAKLFGNSSYGKCGEQVTRRTRNIATNDDSKILKYMKKVTFRQSTELVDQNNDVVACELELHKKRIIDSLPVHFAVNILQESKLLFMQFMEYIERHASPGSCVPVYCDTDSMTFATTSKLGFEKVFYFIIHIF